MTGQEQWRYEPADGARLAGIPIVADDQVLAMTAAGDVIAVGLDGIERWRSALERVSRSQLAVGSHTAWLPTQAGTLVAIDLESGQERWEAAVTGGPAFESVPTIAGDVLYVGDEEGILHALDTADGTERWRLETRTLASSPAVVASVLYAGGGDGFLRAFEDTPAAR